MDKKKEVYMKKVILVLLVALSGYCFGDTGRLEKVVEAFLEKGSYIKVVGKEVKYYPRHSVVGMTVVDSVEADSGEQESGIIVLITANRFYKSPFILFEGEDAVQSDENGNIVVTYK